MLKILGIFVFVPDVYSTIFILLNNILTLTSNTEVQFYSLKN